MPSSFRAARWIRTINLVLQAVLFLSLFTGLNYLARNHAWRFDLTRQRRYSLSPETRSYLHTVKRPVRIIVTLSDDSSNPKAAQAFREVRGLLREYVYETEASDAGKITVEYLDIYQHRREAEQLGLDQANVIVLLSGENRQLVTIDELYRVENRERKAFQGEQVITAAVLGVSNPGKKKIYFLAGHGELNPDDVDPAKGLSQARDMLRQRNFDVDTLSLGYLRKVPEDASLLIAVLPQGRFQPVEVELLRQYLAASAGRLVLMLAPGQPHGLEDLLLDWGVLVDDDLIRDSGPQEMTEEGDLLLRFFTPHPITQTLIDYKLPLAVGPSRSVRPDPGRSLGNGLSVTTLAATSTTAWGEVGYRLRAVPDFTAGVDLKGLPNMEPANRLGVIVASERTSARGNLPFSVKGGRLVVFGTGDLIANNRIPDLAAQNIFLKAVNWAVDSDAQFNIPTRTVERFHLSLSAGELKRLRFSLLFALPGVALLLGLIVYWTRRS